MYILFSFCIGNNCIWKVIDTFLHICFDLEPSICCFYKKDMIQPLNQWFLWFSSSNNHIFWLFVFLEVIIQIFLLSKWKSKYSVSITITYLIALWPSSTNPSAFVLSTSFWRLYGSLQLYLIISCKAREKICTIGYDYIFSIKRSNTL